MATAPIRLILTDVTDLREQVCIAGWAPTLRRMIRPLAGPAEHWPRACADPRLFQLGNIVEMVPAGRPGERGLPHGREDMVVRNRPIYCGRLAADRLARTLQPSESASLVALFAHHLEGGRYVVAGADCPSL